MIPKIIHYTWFSGDEYPEKIKKCIDSWHRFMPDYEFRLWDMKSIENIDSPFLKEAIKMKKWAYAADMVRCYAVYNFGGIYLDTDASASMRWGRDMPSPMNRKTYLAGFRFLSWPASSWAAT